MKIDLTPLYANTVGFDRFGSLLDAALSSDRQAAGYPPYDIELVGGKQVFHYACGSRFYGKRS